MLPEWLMMDAFFFLSLLLFDASLLGMVLFISHSPILSFSRVLGILIYDIITSNVLNFLNLNMIG